jgi:phosphate transport system substrate-binding protein
MKLCSQRPIILLAASGILAGAVRADLRVVGSDLLGLEFTRHFYRFAGESGERLALALDGSRPGLAELRAGRADLAVVVLPPAEAAMLTGYRVVPFGFHRVVILVPAACPLEKITVGQLARIFGADTSGGALTRWGELGIAGEWAEASVAPLAPEVGTGIALEFFRRVVVDSRDFRAGVRRFADANSLSAAFTGTERTLALAAGVPANVPGLKVLPVAVEPGSAAHGPTIENLLSGRYPLCLPLQLVFAEARGATLRVAGEFLFGEEAARLLAAADIVPLPAPMRAASLRAMVAGAAAR